MPTNKIPFFLFLLICLVSNVSAKNNTDTQALPSTHKHKLNLTQKETKWLDKHRTLRVAYDGNFPPYSFVTNSGQYQGLAVDVMDIISKRLGIQLETYADGTWKQLYGAAQNKEVDIVATMVNRAERTKWFNFTAPYIFKSLVIMTRDNNQQITQRKDLAGKQVALVRDYQYVKRILKEYPGIKPYYVDTMLDGLNAVATGKADAAITFFGAGHFLRNKYLLSNLKFAAIYDTKNALESIAVRKDWPELSSIMNKALKSIPKSQMLQLEAKWLPVDAMETMIEVNLTEKEKNWIKEHPVIRLGIDPEFAPFEYMENGVYSGITSDYINILNKRLGTKMEVINGLSWKQVIERAKEKQIDVLPTVGLTEKRKQFLRYTKPYIQFHRVIITRIETPFITGIDDISNRKVSVQSNSSHEGYLRENTTIDPVKYDTLSGALLALSNGRVDAFVGNVASATYWIRKLHLTNLKVAAPVSQELQNLYFAVREDWPELTTILQKGLDSINDRQREKISNKWVLLDYDPVTDFALLGKIIAGFIFILVLFMLWNIQVNRQKKALQKVERQVRDSNKKLAKMYEELEDIVEARTIALQKSEKSFRQAQKMEALGTLVGGIAHDFNNILTGILGSLYLARKNPDNAEKVEKSLSRANELSLRGADLIKQLLGFARKEVVNKSIVSLTSFFKETSTLLETGIEENIRLTLNFSHEDLYLNANSTQLQQLLFNLINNARDALEHNPNPEIVLSSKRFVADDSFHRQHQTLKHKSFALIEVKDNGEGIAAENQERLFDPFFTTKDPGKGTGLGLAMVYNTIRDHGGCIEVISELSKGTNFKIYLPLEEAPDSQIEVIADDIRLGNNETILLVDDDIKLLETNRIILEDLGYNVLSASSGKKALQLFSTHKINIRLVITDIIMPEMNGPLLVKEMHLLEHDLKVIYLTGYDPRGSVASHLKHNTELVLNKPCSVSYLSRVIREQIES